MIPPDQQQQHLKISVIIATYNRAQMLQRCLEALAVQTVDAQIYEVIVVNDGSTDATKHVLTKADFGYTLRVLSQPNAGQASALNTGVSIARAPYCLFLDDDIIAEPSLIDGHVRLQYTSGGAIVMGRLGIRLLRRGDGLAREMARWWDQHYLGLALTGSLKNVVDCHGGNLSVPVAPFKIVGGFACNLPRGYDAELAYKMTRLGYPMMYAQDAGAIQEYDKGWCQAAADFEREGAGGVEIYRSHPELLPHLTLGQFGRGSVAACMLRRALLFLAVPAKPLAWLAATIPDGSVSDRLRSFICSYAYWRGAEKALARTGEWQRLTRTGARGH